MTAPNPQEPNVSETTTPRTDNAAVFVTPAANVSLCEDWAEAVDAEFARTLERALAAALVSKQYSEDAAAIDRDALAVATRARIVAEDQAEAAEARARDAEKDARMWRTYLKYYRIADPELLERELDRAALALGEQGREKGWGAPCGCYPNGNFGQCPAPGCTRSGG